MQRRQSSTFAWPTLSAVAVLAMMVSALGQLAPLQPARDAGTTLTVSLPIALAA